MLHKGVGETGQHKQMFALVLHSIPRGSDYKLGWELKCISFSEHQPKKRLIGTTDWNAPPPDSCSKAAGDQVGAELTAVNLTKLLL